MTPRVRSAAARRAALVLAAAGVAALLTVSAVSADGEDLRADRQGRLVDLVRAEQHRVEERTAALDSVRSEVAALSKQAAAGDARVARALGSGDALAPAAGLVAASGPGLTVVLDDAPRREPGAPLPEGIRPDDLVVHQQDVQAVVNALWEGGATAMSLMDQRVISTSAVRCVGNTLILQGRVYSPPYAVTALGDPVALRAALERAPGVVIYREWVETVGLGYEVRKEQEAKVPAYAGSLDLAYARPAGGER
jgi:uncharacterized protein YlxW (UPF0749 family)